MAPPRFLMSNPASPNVNNLQPSIATIATATAAAGNGRSEDAVMNDFSFGGSTPNLSNDWGVSIIQKKPFTTSTPARRKKYASSTSYFVDCDGQMIGEERTSTKQPTKFFHNNRILNAVEDNTLVMENANPERPAQVPPQVNGYDAGVSFSRLSGAFPKDGSSSSRVVTSLANDNSYQILNTTEGRVLADVCQSIAIQERTQELKREQQQRNALKKPGLRTQKAETFLKPVKVEREEFVKEWEKLESKHGFGPTTYDAKKPNELNDIDVKFQKFGVQRLVSVSSTPTSLNFCGIFNNKMIYGRMKTNPENGKYQLEVRSDCPEAAEAVGLWMFRKM
uniref:Clathrin adaptor alpha-adaptin appendage C-terminal subdomain domain-containing protein n=1 Tax=Panagrolaimus sp. PS1159 TaxID=55785 RepID=A0AC35GHW3_9BILA